MSVITNVVSAWEAWSESPINRNRVVDLDKSLEDLSDLVGFSPLQIRVATIKVLREQQKSATMDVRTALKEALGDLTHDG